MFFGTCQECEFCGALTPSQGLMVCETCADYCEMRRTRCFTFAALYSMETGKLLTVGMSHVGVGCAERYAMWRTNFDVSPKVIVICRIRRSHKKMTFGIAKPCVQCIQAMHFYNVQRICYSTKKQFEWIDLYELDNTYTSASDVIIKCL